MKKTSIKRRLLSLALTVCMALTMMPALLAFAVGEVEITSPAYGSIAEVGEATKIRIVSAEQPTLTVGADALAVASAGEGVWDAVWTPSAAGNTAITASAGGSSDTVLVDAATMVSKIAVASDFTAGQIGDYWFGTQGKVTKNDGFDTVSLDGTHAFVSYAKNQGNQKGPDHGTVVWEADLRLPENGNDLTLKHRDDSKIYEDLFIISSEQGTLYVPGDPANHWVKRIETGAWFNLKTVFDMDAKTYTVYIDDIAVSADNALSAFKAADGIDGLFLQMNWYSSNTDGSFDIKNYALREEAERSLTITSPKAGSMQETGYRMPVLLTANGAAAGDTVTVTGSDGAAATAALISGSGNQYVAYLNPESVSNAYQISASMTGGGKTVTADAVTVKTAATVQLGAWDFNDTSKTAGITAASDNFWGAQKTQSGDSVDWVGGLGGKAADDLAYQLTDTSAAGNTATALNFWPLDDVKYATLIMEFDYYYTGSKFAISTNANPVNGEIYVGADGSIQQSELWTNIATIEKNRWYRMKAVFDKTNNTLDFYLDGKQVLQSAGNYDATTNPTGMKKAVTNDTVWMGCPAWAAGVNTVDNISIRALASDSGLAKKTSAMSVGSIAAIKPGDTFTVNAALPLMSESAAAYINGTKIADLSTKNADGCYQGTITAPANTGEIELTVVDSYGAAATQTVAVKDPDAAFDFSAAANSNGGWSSGKWMIWPTNMIWTADSGKLTSAEGQTGSEMIQINAYPTNGIVVIDFDATVPTNGNGNITIKTRQGAGNEPYLGFAQAGNTGYNDPSSGAWVYSTNVAAGEQRFRYICDLDTHTLTLYIGGNLIFSYVNEKVTQFNALSLAASSAAVTNTLDNVAAYYLPPAGTPGPEPVPEPIYGVSNAVFTTGRDLAFTTENLSGIRRIKFSADLLSENPKNLQVVVAAYEKDENGMLRLTDSSVSKQSVMADALTPVTAELNLSKGLSGDAELKAFIWSDDDMMVPFADVMIP